MQTQADVKQVQSKEDLVLKNSKEANDTMLSYLMQSIKEGKDYEKMKKRGNGILCSFNKQYILQVILVNIFLIWAVWNPQAQERAIAANQTTFDLIGVSLFLGMISFFFVIFTAGLVSGMLSAIFDLDNFEVQRTKEELLRHYGISLKEDFLKSKDGLARVLTMLEDLSNNKYTEGRLSANMIVTEGGNVVNNFAQALSYDIKRWGVNPDNVEYHIGLAVNYLVSSFNKVSNQERVEKENEEINFLLQQA